MKDLTVENMKDLTVEQIQKELAVIMDKYPDNIGSLNNDGDSNCVYYADENGLPVSRVWGTETPDDIYDAKLVTPVCIIGRWVEDFHPELKDDPLFHKVLISNQVISTSIDTVNIFNEDVNEFLGYVQNQQDSGMLTWREINLEQRGER